MTRHNLENANIYDSRFIATKLASFTFRMVGTLVLNSKSPGVLALDLNGVDRDLYLPILEERQYAIANVGTTGILTVRDSNGVQVAQIGPGYIAMFFATASRWVFMTSFSGSSDPTGVTDALRVVTAAGAQVVTAVEAGLVLNKSVASATPITLPLASLRNGKPVRIVDYAGLTDINNVITVTPTAPDKIMNLTSWEISGSDRGLKFCPQPLVGGWTVE